MIRHIVGSRLQPFEQAFVLEDHAYVLSLDLSCRNTEIVDDPALVIIVQHAPLIGDHPVAGHEDITVQERIIDAARSRLYCMDIIDLSHIHNTPDQSAVQILHHYPAIQNFISKLPIKTVRVSCDQYTPKSSVQRQ